MFYLTMLLPLVGGAVLPLFGSKSEKLRCLYIEAVVILTACLVWFQLAGRTEQVYTLMNLTDSLSLRFRIDGCSVVFAGLISCLWPLACLYGFEYMRHEERPTGFFAWYTMTYGITLAIAFSANLFTMYCFYECLTLITLPLVLHKLDALSIRAGRQYVAYSITGAAFGFMALVFSLVFGTGGDFTLGGVLDPSLYAGKERLLQAVFVFAFVGFGTKAAVFPMYAWLPAASVAPTPVTALLHAVAVVNAGAFAVLRLIYYVWGTELLYGTWAQNVVLAIACFTILFGSGMAVREQHLKRRLAYSTISNLSYMLMGAALMTPGGMVGSLSHMIFHGVMKITLFYCAGAILVRSGQEYVQDLRGFSKVMPFTCGVFTVGSVAMVGIPPLCGFVSKWNLLTAAADTGLKMGVVAVAVLIISAVLTAIYLFTVAMSFYFRPVNDRQQALAASRKDPSWLMKLPLGALVCAMAVLGIWSAPVITFLKQLASGMIL